MKKKGGGWEGKKNSIFVKREKRPRGEFLLGILELEKKTQKKRQKKKENILAGYVYQLGQGAGLGGPGVHGATQRNTATRIHAGARAHTHPAGTRANTDTPRDTPRTPFRSSVGQIQTRRQTRR